MEFLTFNNSYKYNWRVFRPFFLNMLPLSSSTTNSIYGYLLIQCFTVCLFTTQISVLTCSTAGKGKASRNNGEPFL